MIKNATGCNDLYYYVAIFIMEFFSKMYCV